MKLIHSCRDKSSIQELAVNYDNDEYTFPPELFFFAAIASFLFHTLIVAWIFHLSL